MVLIWSAVSVTGGFLKFAFYAIKLPLAEIGRTNFENRKSNPFPFPSWVIGITHEHPGRFELYLR
jgi:hypothetical protein